MGRGHHGAEDAEAEASASTGLGRKQRLRAGPHVTPLHERGGVERLTPFQPRSRDVRRGVYGQPLAQAHYQFGQRVVVQVPANQVTGVADARRPRRVF